MALKFDTSTELLSNIVVAVSWYDPLKKKQKINGCELRKRSILASIIGAVGVALYRSKILCH